MRWSSRAVRRAQLAVMRQLYGEDSDAAQAALGRLDAYLTPDPGRYAIPVPYNVALRRESGAAGWLNRAHRKYLNS